MDTVYLISLIVGGFFVLLSIFGGNETDADTDVDTDFDFDADVDVDADFDLDVDADMDVDADFDAGTIGSGPGLVDLFSIRALFLFAAFFGLTGTLLTLVDTGEPWTIILSILTGLVIGLGGNYVIKRVGYRTVSSDLTVKDIRGTTGQVLIPFEGSEKGKITLISKGQRLQLVARSFDDESRSTFERGDDVVVVRMEGSIAEVVKPN